VTPGSFWERIRRRLTPPRNRSSANESDPGLDEHETTLDKARLDAGRAPEQRIDDWIAPMDDHPDRE
jgi:hypothetical protein